MEIARRATSEPPPDLRDAWPDAPRGAAEALERAMARNPADRQGSAGDLVDELRRALLPSAGSRERRTDSVTLPLRTSGGFPRWIPVLALVVVAVVAVLALTMGNDKGGSSGKKAAGAPVHKAKAKAKTQSQPAQTTPAPTAGGAEVGRQLNDQGKALIDAGQPAQAIPILERAVAAFPPEARATDINYAYALFNLADAYFRAGQPDKAIPLLEQRLLIPNQRGVVKHELEEAQRALEQGDNG
jgi:tetratricopeptide (TPR) repeat protein